MLGLIHRLISLSVLVTLLSSPAVPSRIPTITAPSNNYSSISSSNNSAASSAIAPMDLQAPLPLTSQPSITGSPPFSQPSALSLNERVERLRERYEQKHTLKRVVMESFDVPPRLQTGKTDGPYEVIKKGNDEDWPIIEVPPGNHDSVDVDLVLKQNIPVGTPDYFAFAILQVRHGPQQEWSDAEVAKVTGGNISVTVSKRILLGGKSSPTSPIQIRVGCRSVIANNDDYTSYAECKWSNFRFHRDVLDWQAVTNIEPTALYHLDVASTTFNGISPHQGSFLAITYKRDGANEYADTIRYEGPFFTIPYSPNSSAVITASLVWARQRTNGTTSGSMSGLSLKLKVASGSEYDLVTIPTDDTTPSWTTATTSATKTRSYSSATLQNRLVRLTLIKSADFNTRNADHTLAIDSIRLFVDGKPLSIPSDQVVGKCV
jgi:hypothetical protein